MPMPKPKKNESMDDFCACFMGNDAMVKEYPDEKQRYVVAVQQWKDRSEKKEFEEESTEIINIDNVEIFKTGIWNNEKITEDDISDLEKSFAEIGNRIKPYLKIGHRNSRDFDGMPSAGWITNVKKVGESLYADIKNVPSKLGDLISKKAYGRFSPEIFINYRDGDKVHRRVLKGLALLGATTPAVTTLDDFINLYTENCDAIKIYDQLGEENVDNEKIKEYEEKFAKIQKEKETLEKEIESHKKERDQLYFSQIEFFVDEQIKNAKLLPSQREFILALAQGQEIHEYSSDGRKTSGNSLELLKKFFELQPKVVEFGEKSAAVIIDKTEKSEDEKLHEKIKEYSNKNKVSYREAFDAIVNGGE